MGRARWGLLLLALAAVAVSGLESAGGHRTSARAGGQRTGAARTLGQLPVSAQEVISTTLGSHGAGYRAVRTPSGWRLRAGEVTASLGRAAQVRVRTPQGITRLSLTRYGPATVPSAPGRARRNQVSYDLGSLATSYAAGPLGIEQVVTLRRRPRGAGGATLGLRLSAGMSVRVGAGGVDAAISDASGHTVLRYGGLAVSDARRHPVRSWLTGSGSSLTIRIDDTHASYPLHVDPLIQAGRLVIAGTGEQLGQTAVSDDAVFAGAPDAVTPGNPGGAVFVFARPAGGWSGTLKESAVLTASDASSRLGTDVAVSGSTVVAESSNAAYVFTEPAGGWSGAIEQAAELTPSAGGSVGQLALPAPDTVVLGASGGRAGVSVFSEPAGGWAGAVHESATLVASDGATLGQTSLAATPDTIVAGAPEARVGTSTPGAAYVFTQPPGGWSGTVAEAAKLTASDLHGSGVSGFGSNFGEYVALSDDTVVVGDAPGPGVTPQVYVYGMPAAGWHSETESAELTAPDGQLFGVLPNNAFAPAVSGSQVALLGETSPHDPTTARGAVFVYERPSGGWSGEQNESATLQTPDRGLTGPVAITPTGIIEGGESSASGDTVVASGSAYVFDRPAGGWSGTQQPDARLGPSGSPSGERYVFTRPGGSWSDESPAATLAPSGASRRRCFKRSPYPVPQSRSPTSRQSRCTCSRSPRVAGGRRARSPCCVPRMRPRTTCSVGRSRSRAPRSPYRPPAPRSTATSARARPMCSRSLRVAGRGRCRRRRS